MTPQARRYVERWHREQADRRRYDVAERAYDSKWVVWKKRKPLRGISMAWEAIHIADSRKEAMQHMWDIVNVQHAEGSPT